MRLQSMKYGKRNQSGKVDPLWWNIGLCDPENRLLYTFPLGQMIDPLSIYLLLKEVDDPRLKTELENMLEEYV